MRGIVMRPREADGRDETECPDGCESRRPKEWRIHFDITTLIKFRPDIKAPPGSIVAIIEMRDGRCIVVSEIIQAGDLPMDAKTHWERVYSSKRSDELSWYQVDPEPSLRLLDHVGIGPNT